MNYEQFIKNLDLRLAQYFQFHKDYIFCKVGCSECCEQGDYPMYSIELEYLVRGYILLDNATKQIIQQNIKTMKKGGACPFLINKRCSVYAHRPIICRVHGLAYLCKNNVVKLPYCVNTKKNYSKVYKNGIFTINPILEHLDTSNLLNNTNFGEARNLYDWINQSIR